MLPALAALAEPVAPQMHVVEVRLQELLPAEADGLAPAIYQHVLQAGGKRLRPLLTLLSCAAAGGDPAAAVAFATSVEVIHLSSLIHDDVIDEARERRGRPTARERWGNRTSILVGDLLIAEVFRLLSTGFDPHVMGVLAEAVVHMCQSELRETGERRWEAAEARYFASIRGKTASLMGAACHIGALAAANAPAVEPLRDYGLNLGVAFQVTDDLLDLYGDPARLGKPVGQDLAGGHHTLPIIAAWQAGSEGERRALEGLLERCEAGDPGAAAETVELVAALDGREYACHRVGELVQQAKAALEGLVATPARESLEHLADYVLQRES